jgi:hypothetical protein
MKPVRLPPVICFVLIPIAFVGIVATPADARTWTDRRGRQIEADFLGVAEGNVRIKRSSDNKIFLVPLERLSDADQAFIRSHKSEVVAVAESAKEALAITATEKGIGIKYRVPT